MKTCASWSQTSPKTLESFAESRKLLGQGQAVQVVEEEKEQAREFATEFYGDEASPAATSGKSEEVVQTNHIGNARNLPAANHANPSGENQKKTKPAIRERQRKLVAEVPT